MPSAKRDQLVDTALRLFDQHGYHATGIERVIEEAGVARMTLYNHFKSKDDLILAALHRRDETFRNWFVRNVERRASTPRDRLLALFDALGEWFAEKAFCGCVFQKAGAEYGPADHPIHKAAAEHKALMHQYVRGLAEAAGAADPDALANGLELLIQGAIAVRFVMGKADAARDARRNAEILLRDAGL